MSGIELSVVVTASDKTVICGPTMRSLSAAVSAASVRGIEVERLIALCGATNECRQYFSQPDFDDWSRLDIDSGHLGISREHIVSKCSGKYITFVNSIDLVSENWFYEAVTLLREAESSGKCVIVYPELYWEFDGKKSIVAEPNQYQDIFTPYYLYHSDYYQAHFIAPRRAFLEHPVAGGEGSRDAPHQDWRFYIETMTANWKHVTAANTIMFKRCHDVAPNAAESVSYPAAPLELEPLAIDRISELSKS